MTPFSDPPPTSTVGEPGGKGLVWITFREKSPVQKGEVLRELEAAASSERDAHATHPHHTPDLHLRY
jgi:hypothetical protein